MKSMQKRMKECEDLIENTLCICPTDEKKLKEFFLNQLFEIAQDQFEWGLKLIEDRIKENYNGKRS